MDTNPLACGRPFVLGVANQGDIQCGPGLACDPILSNYVSALSPFTYSRGAFPWLIGAVGNITQTASTAADGGNLLMLAGTTIKLFADGQGDALTSEGLWWTGTYNDTDLLAGGARTDIGQQFYMMGVACQVGDSFQRGLTGANSVGTTASTDPLIRSIWLSSDSHYQRALGRSVLQSASMQLTFGSQPITYQIGVLCDSPSWGGDSSVQNGHTNVPGLYLPFNSGVICGARDQIKKMTLVLAIFQAQVVENDPVQPTVQSLYNLGPTPPAGSPGNVFTPVRVVGVGYIVSVPGADGSISVSPDVLAQIVASRQGK